MNLSRLSEESDGKMHSGCTAVTAFLRLEDENGSQSFLPSDFELPAPSIPSPSEALNDSNSNDSNPSEADSKSKGTTSKLLHAIKTLGTASSHSSPSSANPDPVKAEPEKAVVPPSSVRRVLYYANAEDARGVLRRAAKAVRLTYDYKGPEKHKAKRIMDARGFVMSGYVNCVLNVSRSLGDSSMKEFVVGSPYMSETDLSEQDEFPNRASDGVSYSILSYALRY